MQNGEFLDSIKASQFGSVVFHTSNSLLAYESTWTLSVLGEGGGEERTLTLRSFFFSGADTMSKLHRA